MNFFGMGMMEILLILILAFIFLGPERMVDAAKTLGKIVRDGRKFAAELPQVVLEDDDLKIINPVRNPDLPIHGGNHTQSPLSEEDTSDKPVDHRPMQQDTCTPVEPTDNPPVT